MKPAADAPFSVLGVRPDAPDAEVKAAWLLRVQESHPDRLVDAPPETVEAALEQTKRLNAAYAEVKRRRAAGEGPQPRGGVSGAPARPPRAVDEPRTAPEALHRAERAVEDARAALEASERAVRLIRSGLRTIGHDLAGHEKRADEACTHATTAETLAGGLPVAAREAAARGLAGEALRLVASALALPASHRNERRTHLVRAEAIATLGLSRLTEARRAADDVVADGVSQVDRLAARIRPVARDIAGRVVKANDEAKRYRTLLSALPATTEPARVAVERAVVAAARARGLVEALASAEPPEVAAHWRRRADLLERAAGDLAPRIPPEAPVPAGSPYALPKPEVVLAAAARLTAAGARAGEAARRADAAVAAARALRARGTDAVVSEALGFVDAQLSALRGALGDRDPA